MPVNERTELKNRHTLFLAKSGHGKSQCLKRKAQLPSARSGGRVVLFDPNKDHEGHRFSKFPEFCRALANAVKSGKGFWISYTGPRSLIVFEKWCQAVNAILDGTKDTYIVIEEYGRVCGTSGSLKPESAQGMLWSESRKYGGIIIATSQRPQAISKDATENAAVIWAGKMGRLAAARVAEEIELHPDQLKKDLPAGTFWYKHESDDEAEKIHVFTPI